VKNQSTEPIFDNLELLGTILREIRMQLNLTQEQVSTATGLHINTVSNIERGFSCRLDNFIIIAHFYGLKPSDILDVIDL
jgi:transcriptional regulator with XRE-family HTH domain